jgi:hypothetical protein
MLLRASISGDESYIDTSKETFLGRCDNQLLSNLTINYHWSFIIAHFSTSIREIKEIIVGT